MGKGRYTTAQFLKAIPGSGGVVSTIAKRMGCDWITVKRYIEKYPTIREAYDAECETTADTAESVVRTNITLARKIQKEAIGKKKYRAAVVDSSDAKWWLARKRKGFSDKAELTGADGGPLTVTYINDWRDD